MEQNEIYVRLGQFQAPIFKEKVTGIPPYGTLVLDKLGEQ